MKKIIFIGGASYSGTTFLDMIIGNDAKGFSCGEVSALFYPFKEKHKDFKCDCGEINCDIWNQVIKNGKNSVYETIFAMLPHVEFIVDSSKDPIWIQEQMNINRNNDIQIKNVLIFKSPLESASSFEKRGRLNEFEKSWVNYHRQYFSLIKEFIAIEYAMLATNSNLLKILCKCLQIPYFDSKINYWQKTHHTLFGNTSAKMHLLLKNSDAYDKYKKILRNSGRNKAIVKKEFQKIYYKQINDSKLKNLITDISRRNTNFKLINQFLKEKQLVFHHSHEKQNIDKNLIEQLKFSYIQLQCRVLKRAYRVKRLTFLQRI